MSRRRRRLRLNWATISAVIFCTAVWTAFTLWVIDQANTWSRIP